VGPGSVGIDFSYEGVKGVVGLLITFVFTIASPPCDFLYLNQPIDDIKKNKEKTNKKAQYFLGSLHYLVFLSRLLYFRI